MHAIVITDTNPSDIGASVFLNQNHVIDQLHTIAKETDLTLKLTKIEGKNCLPRVLFNHVNKLTVNKDDVVFFYWNGHGFRTHSKGKSNPWPSLYFSDVYQGVDLKVVFDRLKAKQPRLLIALADTCNSYINWNPHMVRKAFPSFAPRVTIQRNYRELFLNTEGQIIASSSKPGEYSWCDFSSGGFFTTVFLANLTRETNSDNTSKWDHVFSEMAKEFQMRYWRYSQHPQWLIN